MAIYLRDVMKKVRTTDPTELIYGADCLGALAQDRVHPWPMACPQTQGHVGAVL
jgi:hypothetical protein